MESEISRTKWKEKWEKSKIKWEIEEVGEKLEFKSSFMASSAYASHSFLLKEKTMTGAKLRSTHIFTSLKTSEPALSVGPPGRYEYTEHIPLCLLSLFLYPVDE